MQLKPAVFCWSGGKDSALALHQVKFSKRYHVHSLFTTVTEDYNRISMHGVRRRLLQEQARSLNLPLTEVMISKESANEEYEKKMKETLLSLKNKKIRTTIFGDIFLEDIRRYREKNMRQIKMWAVFPLWKKDTTELANKFIDLGYKSIIVCTDGEKLDKSFCGRMFDKKFLNDLPDEIDPCGENGEFHTFVFDGPIFSFPVKFEIGKVTQRNGRFWYCDLI